MATLLGFDVSHHQGAVNFAAAKSAARSFVVIKATDGVGWTDPSFAANRKAAHAAGLTVGLYHFAEGGNPVNEAAYFCGVIGALQPGEFLVLDWECAYSSDHVAWCKAWLNAVTAKTGVRPFIYMNVSTMNGHNWMPLSGDHALWLAKYDGTTTPPASCNCWTSAAMKQYSDAGSVLGVAGGCDVNVFYGDASQLAAYGAGGDDMPTLDEIGALIDAKLRPIYDTLTPGISGVKLNGDVWAKVSAAADQLTGNNAGTLNHDLRSWCDVNGKGIAQIATKVGQVQAPAVDPQALADALVADTQAVATLADALAAAIAKRLGNG